MVASRRLDSSRRLDITRRENKSRVLAVNIERSEPFYVYLTCGESVPNEMFVTYHIGDNFPMRKVLYRKRGTSSWSDVSPVRVPFQNEPINIYHSKLENLSGDTEYEFKIGEDSTEIHKFITMPSDLSTPVNIAFGSDFHHGYDTFKRNLKVVSDNDCRMFVFGGDFVDDDGDLNKSYKWVEFWEIVAPRLVDSKGRLIPWVTILGNHEFAPVNNMNNLFFHDMFPFPPADPNYGVVDVGNYMSLYLLDFISRGYTNNGGKKWEDVDLSAQLSWLEGKLHDRSNKPFNVPVYHPAMYSSDRVPLFVEERQPYRDLFKEHNIKLAFCGHDHVYKKTHPIVFGESTEQDRVANSGEVGFIEIGDGGIADKLYQGQRVGEWYIDTYAIHKPHVNIIKLESDKMTIEAKGTDGQVFDSTIINAQ